ncbi:PspC domain-containing protein [Microaerobacter geothermalis]|uniref:PspC domain-containing protein n=1 Tax=Microaerobacter geothermalis TaxID=674972 RepID=UPI001F35F277|nr:PspC domain-containing protein [Microaerobacter geothermalis]MCF6094559.1 PspC domain-containing protein [Microaerobacter geothermalis]
MGKKLRRSSTNRMIAGVCGGIGEYFDIDPTIIRLLYVLISIFSAVFPGLLIYIIAMFIMPREH